MGQKSLPSDPFADAVPMFEAGDGKVEPKKPKSEKAIEKPTKVKEEGKTGLKAMLPESLAEEVRACVVMLQGPPEFMTVSKFIENSLRAELEKMSGKHNNGAPFKVAKNVSPRRGRPVGV